MTTRYLSEQKISLKNASYMPLSAHTWVRLPLRVSLVLYLTSPSYTDCLCIGLITASHDLCLLRLQLVGNPNFKLEELTTVSLKTQIQPDLSPAIENVEIF